MPVPAAAAANRAADTEGGSWSIATPEAIFEVDTRTAAELVDVVERLTSEFPEVPLDGHDLLVRAELEMRRCSPELLAALVSFRLLGSADGVLLIRGLPIDDPLPPTPADGSFRQPWRTLPVSTITQLMMLSVLGDVISYADEKDGCLIQDICPVPGAETRQENVGSCLLELHTEDGFHPNKPHFLSLFGLRADHERQAITVASSIRRVFHLLSPEQVAILRRPLFRIRLSSSFTGADQVRYSDPMPILSGAVDDPDLCVDFYGMQPLSEPAREAFDALHKLMLGAMVGAAIEPGDLLVVDNRKAVHGRTGFVPRYDGEDRWLRRCFTISDIRVAYPQLFPESRMHRPIVESV